MSTSEKKTNNYRHPKALYLLSFSELWERFSYYGMRAILPLFITARLIEGGWEWSDGESSIFCGIYGTFVYLASIPGGIIADRYLGAHKATLWGAFFQIIGHISLASSNSNIFIWGLFMLSMGTGLYKTNISSLVGSLYEKGDKRSDAGFAIFYRWLNVGVIFSGIVVGLLAKWGGFHTGFTGAGIGMLCSFIILLFGEKYLEEKKTKEDNTHISKNNLGQYAGVAMLFLGLVVLGLIFLLSRYTSVGFVYIKSSFRLIMATALFIMVSFLILLIRDKSLDKLVRDNIKVLCFVLLAIYIQCMVLEQSGSFFSTYTKNHIDRFIRFTSIFGNKELPTAFYSSINPIFCVIFGTIVSSVCSYLELQKRFKVSVISLMGIGMFLLSLSCICFIYLEIKRTNLVSVQGEGSKVGSSLLVLSYLLQVFSELAVLPVAFSFLTQVAPKKLRSTLMGILWGITGCGIGIAGEIGALTDMDGYGVMPVFTALTIITASIGLLYMILDQKASFSPIKRTQL